MNVSLPEIKEKGKKEEEDLSVSINAKIVQCSTVKNGLEHHTNQVTMTLESAPEFPHVCSSTENRKAVENRTCVFQEAPVPSFAPFLTTRRNNVPKLKQQLKKF